MSDPFMLMQWLKMAIVWLTLFLIEAGGAYAFWLRVIEPFRPPPGVSSLYKIYLLLITFGSVPAFVIPFLVLVWIPKSCAVVKQALEEAGEDDYEEVNEILFSRWWTIFPRPKYASIIRILKQLCNDRKRRPRGVPHAFEKFIVSNDRGEFTISLEGRNRMVQIVDAGLFSSKQSDEFSSPKTIRLLMGLVAIVALIKGVALIVHMLVRH